MVTGLVAGRLTLELHGDRSDILVRRHEQGQITRSSKRLDRALNCDTARLEFDNIIRSWQ